MAFNAIVGGKGIPHFISLHFLVLHSFCVFYKLKVCGNLVSSKSIGAIFPTAFAHFVSLCHILLISQYFKLLNYCICYGDL